MFESDSGLLDVKLADVTCLPKSFFNGCSSLKEIVIPETVTNIEDNCFTGCTSLGSITSLSLNAPTLGSNVFGDKMTNYTGSSASTKVLSIPANAVGYELGDWKIVLQDKVGFTLNKTL